MTTDKQKLSDKGWQSPTQDVTDGKWYAIFYDVKQSCYWWGKDLHGDARLDWHPISDGDMLIERINALKVAHRFVLADWL